eukprot:1621883-Heterocapsa_arctica.AAC.1
MSETMSPPPRPPSRPSAWARAPEGRQQSLAAPSCLAGRHRGDAARGAAWTPSGCYSRLEHGRPRAACRRRSGTAGWAGCPPRPGSWPSRGRWCQTPLRPA